MSEKKKQLRDIVGSKCSASAKMGQLEDMTVRRQRK